MTRDRIVAAALLALLIVASWIASAPRGPSGATRSSSDDAYGGVHAWYELLAREGAHVERFHGHAAALAGAGIGRLVLVAPGPGTASLWDDGDAAALAAWVRAGGHATLAGELPATRGGLDVRLHVRARRLRGALYGPWSALVRDLPARSGLRIVTSAHARAEVLLADAGGVLVVRERFGRGSVVVLADPRALENDALARGGDARLAYLLAVSPRSRGTIAFDEALHGALAGRPWYRALNAGELLALALAALAGVLWLIDGLLPLGPPVRLFAAREPTSAEFLDAVAALYARAGARERACAILAADACRSLEGAPRGERSAALRARVAAAADRPADDAALIDLARLARLAREDTLRERHRNPGRPALAGGPLGRRRRR